MTFAQLPVGQPFRIGKATYTKISWGTASRDRDKAYVGIAQSAEVEPNLSSGVEGHTESPCKHGDLAKADLMASAHSLVQPDNASGNQAPPAQSFSEQLEATGDSIERSFAEQLQDSGDKLSPEQPK